MAIPNRQNRPSTFKSEQGVLNTSFDEEFGVLAVEGLEYHEGSNTLIRSGGSLTERYDYDVSTAIYTGTAVVGTSESSTGWTITKYDLTDTNNASGKVATDVSWTNRATGTYQ